MEPIRRRSTLWRVLLFFILITAFFDLVIMATMPKYKSASTPADIAKTDLAQDYICLDSSAATVYPGALLTPADIVAGRTDGQPGTNYETCRITLALRPGVTYGITGQTATYAQRVYINGVLLSQLGNVSADAAAFTPRTDLYTVYFTPTQPETELVIQHAWLNHQHGTLQKLFLAEQQVITRTVRAQTLCDGLLVGTLLGMALFFFGMFFFRSANLGMLWFALSCLCAAAHYLIYESKQIMVFFPTLNWYLGHKVELLLNIYYFVFILLFAFSALQYRPKRWFSVVSWAVLGALSVFYIAAPAPFYTKYLVPAGGVLMGYMLLAVVTLLRGAWRAGKLRQADRWIVALSPPLTLAVYCIEGATYFSHILYLRAYAMILLAFCNALALTINFARTTQQLNDAQRRELATAEENAMLEKMNSLRNDFMRNIAHEMKTPLTVMSGYAQLTGRQIQRNAVDAETTANLETIAREAGRLSDMVTQLLDVTYHGDAGTRTCFAPQQLLEDAAAVCRPVLQKNGNQLRLQCESSQTLCANHAALLQVLINLAINSNKHTGHGWVAFRAADAPGFVRFSVTDDGSGIAPDDLPHIFERGYGTDGGNGLGLTICRDIIESTGGAIAVTETNEAGTTIAFTVPAQPEETAKGAAT